VRMEVCGLLVPRETLQDNVFPSRFSFSKAWLLWMLGLPRRETGFTSPGLCWKARGVRSTRPLFCHWAGQFCQAAAVGRGQMNKDWSLRLALTLKDLRKAPGGAWRALPTEPGPGLPVFGSSLGLAND
jgi:hypothetical protein